MMTKKLIGFTAVVCIVAGAGLVSANPCFDNETVNTCTRLTPLDPEGDDCYINASNNSCSQEFSVEVGLLTVGSPTSSDCTYMLGKKTEDGCEATGASQQTVTVQCTPAAGGACPAGGGGEG